MPKLVQEVESGVVLTVKVVPGSSRNAFCGLLDGAVKIKISAPPEKGRANRGLVEFLAGFLGVKKNAIKIVGGTACPVKSVLICGVTAEQMLKKLGTAVVSNESGNL